MMVCPYNDEQLLLILQVDHSKVTGWLAAHWGNDDFASPSPYQAMVLAAQEHDTGWWDWEIKPQINDEGLPPDYIGSIKHLGRPYGSTSTVTALHDWPSRTRTQAIWSPCMPKPC